MVVTSRAAHRVFASLVTGGMQQYGYWSHSPGTLVAPVEGRLGVEFMKESERAHEYQSLGGLEAEGH